jgi:uncharacterized protein (DUF1778 family)
MKDEYDFSDGKRGAVASAKGKTRITIMLDDAVIEAARTVAENEGFRLSDSDQQHPAPRLAR